MGIKPSFKRIFIEKEIVEKSSGGLYIKDDLQGNVFFVSDPGKSTIVTRGDKVMVNLRGIREIKLDGSCFVSIDEEDILCVMGKV
jgi:co-chaperonin GroES (HSP10)